MNSAAGGALRRALRLASIVCLLTIAFHGSATAQSQRPLKTLTVLGFEGAFNLPVWIAQQNGYFERQGLIVKLEYPKGSVEVVERLQSNTGQLALTSVDNVIAYANGQGEATSGLAADLVAVMDPTGIERMQASLPDFRGATVIEGAGHWTQQERPAEFNAALLGYLREVSDAS